MFLMGMGTLREVNLQGFNPGSAERWCFVVVCKSIGVLKRLWRAKSGSIGSAVTCEC